MRLSSGSQALGPTEGTGCRLEDCVTRSPLGMFALCAVRRSRQRWKRNDSWRLGLRFHLSGFLLLLVFPPSKAGPAFTLLSRWGSSQPGWVTVPAATRCWEGGSRSACRIRFWDGIRVCVFLFAGCRLCRAQGTLFSASEPEVCVTGPR